MISNTRTAIGKNLQLFTTNSVNSGKFQDRHLQFYEAISLPSQLQVFGVLPEYALQRWPVPSPIPAFLNSPLMNHSGTMHELLATSDNVVHSLIDLSTSNIEVVVNISDKTGTLLCSVQFTLNLYTADIVAIKEN